MARSSHHLPLPSLPPPRVVLCSPFVCLLLLPRRRESSKERARAPARRRGIAASHLSRGPGPAESLPICKRVADGHHRHPAGPPRPSVYIDTISGDRYLACRSHFFSPPPRPNVPPARLLLRVQPPMNHTLPRDIPITNSTPTRSAVSPGFGNTRIVPLVNVFAG